jgi:hypothetical protein
MIGSRCVRLQCPLKMHMCLPRKQRAHWCLAMMSEVACIVPAKPGIPSGNGKSKWATRLCALPLAWPMLREYLVLCIKAV